MSLRLITDADRARAAPGARASVLGVGPPNYPISNLSLARLRTVNVVHINADDAKDYVVTGHLRADFCAHEVIEVTQSRVSPLNARAVCVTCPRARAS